MKEVSESPRSHQTPSTKTVIRVVIAGIDGLVVKDNLSELLARNGSIPSWAGAARRCST